jgi:hypothetical protein
MRGNNEKYILNHNGNSPIDFTIFINMNNKLFCQAKMKICKYPNPVWDIKSILIYTAVSVNDKLIDDVDDSRV